MTPTEVRNGLAILRNYYAKDGQPHALNDAQWGVYIAGLSRFQPEELTAAANTWMQRSKWFPALSDLLELLAPEASATAAAHLAWTAVERAIREAGAYRGATFADNAVGETVRQVFGSWSHACSYDWDSPGWAIKRQTFLAVFPSMLARATDEPVTLRGQFRHESPCLIGHIAGLPAPSPRPELSGHVTHQEAVNALATVKALYEASKRSGATAIDAEKAQTRA